MFTLNNYELNNEYFERDSYESIIPKEDLDELIDQAELEYFLEEMEVDVLREIGFDIDNFKEYY